MTVTHNATAADLDAAPAGSTLLDRDGDNATKMQDGGWRWTPNAGSVSYDTVTLQRVWGPIRLTTPDLAPADEPGPGIDDASYDSVSKVASVRVNHKLYQINAANRPLADAVSMARTYARDTARSAAAYARLTSLLEGALREEEAAEQGALVKTLRAQALTEAGISRSYNSTGPSVRRLVDVAVAAKLALHKAQEAAK